MANKTVTITNAASITRSDGDTLLSFNIYSDKPSASTLIDNISLAEATAGVLVTFPDGVIHNVTAKSVWQTAGETALEISNIIVVDLSAPIGPATPIITAAETGGTADDEIANYTLVSHSDFTVDVGAIVVFNGSSISIVANQLHVTKAGATSAGAAINYTPTAGKKVIIKFKVVDLANATDCSAMYTWGPEDGNLSTLNLADINEKLLTGRFVDGSESTVLDRYVFYPANGVADDVFIIDEYWLYEEN